MDPPDQWGAQVTDSYTLTNPADGSVTVNALYPVSTSWLDFPELNAAVTVDSGGTGFSVLSGGYAGGFQDAGEPGRLHLEPGPARTNGPIIRHFWQTENTCPGRWRKLLSRRFR